MIGINRRRNLISFVEAHMRIGVPKEIKPQECRVALTDEVVAALVARGHELFVERGAGVGIGLADDCYVAAGATILDGPDAVFEAAQLIVKVKEPMAEEVARLLPRHLLFTYLHLAAAPALAQGLVRSGCTAIGYETVTDPAGRLPLLVPMSQVAGRMAVDVGAVNLLTPAGGRGILLGGVPGAARAKVIILGGGAAGEQAAIMALGHHADVAIFDISLSRLEALDARFDGRLETLYSTRASIVAALPGADLVIGCVLVPGGRAPKLVRTEDLKTMQRGSVMVDVAIDQGGCFETSRPTTHADPTYVVEGVIHYCVTNMPGAAPRTATYALNAATAPYVTAIADLGLEGAYGRFPGLRDGVNVADGRVVHAAVAQALATT